MSLWWTRTMQGRRSTIAVEGLGLVVCIAMALVAALVAWIVS